MESDKDYYEFDDDFDVLLLENGLIDEMFYMRDLQQRKLFLVDGVSQDTVIDIVKHILQINKEDKGIEPENRRPILLYVSSPGGEVDAGYELIDAIIASKTPVYTINLGYQYSMGFLIGLAGHKRFATPNSKFLIHDGSSFTYGSTNKVLDQVKFQEKVEDRTRKYILSRSNLSAEEYDKNLRVEWYLFADEAKEKGLTDYIIGVDCDVDMII